MNKSILLAVLTALVALCLMFASCDSGSSDPVPVAGVSLDKDTLLLKTGTYGTLTATVLPENATNKSVTWSSDKPDIATVDRNGKVTGVAEGTATIVAITADGVKTAVCVVTVADEFYTVKFYVQGHGTALEEQYAAKDGKISEPTEPVSEGYALKGWYKEAACTNRWKFNADTVTADMTLYAKWVKVYKVSFVANGGSGTMSDVPVEDRTIYEIPASTLTGPEIPVGAVNEGANIPFKCWKDENGTEYAAGALIPVSTDITLTAQWAKPSFTVVDSEGTVKKVYFAKGNLQAVFESGGSTKTWKFADHQYDYIGDAVANTAINGNGKVSKAGTVDLFGWSTDATDFGISNSTASSDYSGAFKDWGCIESLPGNSSTIKVWSTLSNDEWEYLLNTRTVNGATGEGKSYQRATINSDKSDNTKVYGVIIYPDNYTEQTAAESYTSAEWSAMENAGCVFLPAAGYRSNFSVFSVGDYGNYWSATPVYHLVFNVYGMSPDSDGGRSFGQSVRLVRGEKQD